MEATALYPFDATQADELSFRDGDILKVKSKDEGGWYHAELNGKCGFIPSTYIRMEPHSWYKGNLSRREAERQLMSARYDGAFIIRDCQTDKNQFSLSVMHNKSTQHFKILSGPNGTYYLWPEIPFGSINKLIDHHRTVSVAREPTSRIFLRDGQEEEEFMAMYDFSPDSPDELPFCKGARIKITEKNHNDWWTGRNLDTGKAGLLPCNYIKKMK
ncbi:growth factor receptor-bound protein 2-like isoform X2 [Babylonia areolata]|uniref:growth factor receptor-bound protein 2-like isoform X2 n=1 Tax=Babylonia areolata TaxID=304850 RepID=UPI003FD10D7F